MRTRLVCSVLSGLALLGCSSGMGTSRSPVTRGANPTPIPETRSYPGTSGNGLGSPGRTPANGPVLGEPQSKSHKAKSPAGSEPALTQRSNQLPSALRSSGYRGSVPPPAQHEPVAEQSPKGKRVQSAPVTKKKEQVGPPAKGY